MNNELLNAAKDEAARENRFNDWDDVITYNLSFGLSNNRLEALINRAMEIYASKQREQGIREGFEAAREQADDEKGWPSYVYPTIDDYLNSKK